MIAALRRRAQRPGGGQGGSGQGGIGQGGSGQGGSGQGGGGQGGSGQGGSGQGGGGQGGSGQGGIERGGIERGGSAQAGGAAPPPQAQSRAHPPARKGARELATLIAECAASGTDRSVLAVRLSLLPASRRRPHHVRLAEAALDPLTFADRASLFELANQDLVMVWRGAATAAVTACRRALSHLFADDGSAAQNAHLDRTATNDTTVSEPAMDRLLELLRLPADTRRLLAILEESLPPPPPPPPPEPHGAPLDAATVAAIEEQLRHADMAPFVRRRPVCASGPDGRMTTAWEGRILAVKELVATLLPGRAVDTEGWLFRRLTRTLDRRMLALLCDSGELRHAGPFSVELNVSSILSPEFLRFDNSLPARLRGEVVLGLLPADVVADPSAFMLARDFVRARGYVLLLRDVTAPALAVFSREELGVDWVQLHWSPALAALPDPLEHTDPGHVVLAGTDTPAALAWGRAHHVARFCGTAAQPG